MTGAAAGAACRIEMRLRDTAGSRAEADRAFTAALAAYPALHAETREARFSDRGLQLPWRSLFVHPPQRGGLADRDAVTAKGAFAATELDTRESTRSRHQD